jgi:hypothetical protein
MKKNLPVIVTGIAALFLLMGCFHHKTPEEKAEWIVEEITEELELTENQQGYLEDLKKVVLEKRKNHQAEKQKHYNSIKKQFLGEDLTEDMFGEFVTTHAEKIKEEGQPVWTAFIVFQKSLTLEQKQQVVEHMDSFTKKGKRCHFFKSE